MHAFNRGNELTAYCLVPAVDWLGYISHVEGAGVASGCS